MLKLSDGYYAEDVANGTLHFSGASRKIAHDLMIHYKCLQPPTTLPYNHSISPKRNEEKLITLTTRSDFVEENKDRCKSKS